MKEGEKDCASLASRPSRQASKFSTDWLIGREHWLTGLACEPKNLLHSVGYRYVQA